MTSVPAPAKINLCLRVGERREDGYHRVATLFAAIDLHDRLEIGSSEETVVEGFAEDTLVRRALDALGETRRVRLEKRIPVAAGLGGGSSDAAGSGFGAVGAVRRACGPGGVVAGAVAGGVGWVRVDRADWGGGDSPAGPDS